MRDLKKDESLASLAQPEPFIPPAPAAAKIGELEPALCELCKQPMPEGEEMFKYHGYSGPCPKKEAANARNASVATGASEAAVNDALLASEVPRCPKCGCKHFSVVMMGRDNQMGVCGDFVCPFKGPVEQFFSSGPISPAAEQGKEEKQ